ncbi:MAG TPA: helix-turn-helix domain-containing protein, partial [Hyphomicrobiaceae bacterium]|nr:helix-turn-helix domain-containing protein [Hyphomicrobiaceae bacterium]
MAALSYKYRIEPNRAQATAFGDMLADFCQLYNAGLEQRIAAYRRRSRCGATHFGSAWGLGGRERIM